jgi:hypothetical protein
MSPKKIILWANQNDSLQKEKKKGKNLSRPHLINITNKYNNCHEIWVKKEGKRLFFNLNF